MMERKRDRATERRRDRESAGIRLSLSLLLSVALSLYLSFPTPTAAHKYHFSFAQIEYNAKEKTAEITLRVFADDLENALSKRNGKPVKLDHKEAAAIVAEYVREKLEIKGRDGRVKRLAWIGMESKVDVALLYLEAKMPEGMTGAQLRFRLFFELFEDQVNQALLKSGSSRNSLEFKSGDGFKPLAIPVKP